MSISGLHFLTPVAMPSESVLHWQCQVPMLKWHVASFQSLRHMVPANHKGPGMILYYVPRGGEPEIVGNQHYPHAMDNPMMFAGKTSLQPTSRNEAPLVFCDYKGFPLCLSVPSDPVYSPDYQHNSGTSTELAVLWLTPLTPEPTLSARHRVGTHKTCLE